MSDATGGARSPANKVKYKALRVRGHSHLIAVPSRFAKNEPKGTGRFGSGRPSARRKKQNQLAHGIPIRHVTEKIYKKWLIMEVQHTTTFALPNQGESRYVSEFGLWYG